MRYNTRRSRRSGWVGLGGREEGEKGTGEKIERGERREERNVESGR
jgi:hypothetical protein